MKIDISLPLDFPEKYQRAFKPMIENCLVNKLAKGYDQAVFVHSITRGDSPVIAGH